MRIKGEFLKFRSSFDILVDEIRNNIKSIFILRLSGRLKWPSADRWSRNSIDKASDSWKDKEKGEGEEGARGALHGRLHAALSKRGRGEIRRFRLVAVAPGDFVTIGWPTKKALCRGQITLQAFTD